jgi:hypothetical protein
MSGPHCVRCPFADCGLKADTSAIVKQHIKDEHAEYDKDSKRKDYRFLCGGCAKSLRRFEFFNHIRSCERPVDVSVNRNHKRPFSAVDGDECEDISDTVDGVGVATVDVVGGDISDATIEPALPSTEAVLDDCYARQISKIVDCEYLQFATDHALSLAVVVESIKISSTLNKNSIDHAQHLFRRLLTKHLSNDPAKIQQIMNDVPAAMRSVRQPLRLINTEYYLEQYFRSMSTYVPSVYVSFMKSNITVSHSCIFICRLYFAKKHMKYLFAGTLHR